MGFVLSRLGIVRARPGVERCSRLSSVPALLLYMAAKDIGVPVKEGGVDTLSAVVVVKREEIDGVALFSTRDAVALGIRKGGETKAVAYDLAFFAEKARLEIAATVLGEDAVAASYRLKYSKGVITAAALYKIKDNTVYLDKLTVNGQPKILVSCANQCQDDTDCAPPNPDCLNYCCAWNTNCLSNCCADCLIPCMVGGLAACILCVLLHCGLKCMQYTCCTKYHKIYAGHGR